MLNYSETINYLYKQLPMYQRMGAPAFKKNLDNILALCDELGNPQDKLKCIHVAGTNGKGTVSHILAAGLVVSGYKTGIYTSPHYNDFRERIKIGNKLISKKYVCDFVSNNITLIERIQPSFFEITVAMAFDYFNSQNVDYAVIEVGLGGRLDSTNIIDPILSIITNISMDHTNMLGDTIELIAAEKAGIIKPNKPVLIGEKQIKTTKIFQEKAKDTGASLYFAEELGRTEFSSESDSSLNCKVFQKGINKVNFEIDIKGDFQQKNINTALQSLIYLNELGIKINYNNIKEKFNNFRSLLAYKGRWQKINKQPTVFVDSAHNEAGIKNVIQMLQELNPKIVHWVFGMVNDKKPESILKYLPKQWKYYFAKANIPRGLDSNILKNQAEKLKLNGFAYTSVRKALAAAKLSCKEDEIIFVGGSIFVVAEVIK